MDPSNPPVPVPPDAAALSALAILADLALSDLAVRPSVSVDGWHPSHSTNAHVERRGGTQRQRQRATGRLGIHWQLAIGLNWLELQ